MELRSNTKQKQTQTKQPPEDNGKWTEAWRLVGSAHLLGERDLKNSTGGFLPQLLAWVTVVTGHRVPETRNRKNVHAVKSEGLLGGKESEKAPQTLATMSLTPTHAGTDPPELSESKLSGLKSQLLLKQRVCSSKPLPHCSFSMRH